MRITVRTIRVFLRYIGSLLITLGPAHFWAGPLSWADLYVIWAQALKR